MPSPSAPLRGVRVLVIARSTTAHANSGGMEASAQALVHALHRLDTRTALVTTSTGDAPLPDRFDGHEHVWEIATRKPGRYSLTWWRNARWCGPWTTWYPDLVLGIGDAAGRFTRNSTVPVVVHNHGTTVMEAWSALAARNVKGIARSCVNLARTPSRTLYLKRSDLIMSAGEPARASLSKFPYRIPPDRLTVLNNAVDDKLFAFSQSARGTWRAHLGVEDGTPLYASVGRLSEDKGVDLAIQLLSKQENGVLAVVGDGPSHDDLKRLAAHSGVEERVRFMGRRTAIEIAGLMSGCDQLWFLTRRRETSPMVILEAAMNGLPTLTTRWAQVPQPLRHLCSVIDDPCVDEAARFVITCGAPTDTRSPTLPSEFWLRTLPSRLETSLASAVRPVDR